MKTKICTKCKIEKPLNEFHKQKTGKFGLQSYCKLCNSETKEQWKLNHPDKLKETNKKYRLEHRKEIKERDKIYNQVHKEEMKRKRNIYLKKRRKTDPLYKSICLMRDMLYRVLNLIGTKKQDRTINILGYTPKQLMDHIEKQFSSEMNWENHGIYWVIDHIISIAWLIKNNIRDPKLINGLLNLQPLTIEENQIKGDKLINENNLNLEEILL